MKKMWIVGTIAILTILLIVLLIIIFYYKPLTIEENGYNITKEEQITFISGWVEELEECQGRSKYSSQEEALEAGYNQFCIYITDVDDANLSKLKLLENITGILLYNDNSHDSGYNFIVCNKLWEFNYETVFATVIQRRIDVYKCEDKFYLTSLSYPGPPDIMIYKINLSQETLDLLKEEEKVLEDPYQEVLEAIQKGNEYGIANNITDFCFPWRSYERRCTYKQDKFYELYNSNYALNNFSREQKINVCYEFAHKGSVADCLRKINESEECLGFANGDDYLTALCNLKYGVLPYTGEPGIPEGVKTYPLVMFSG